MKLMPRKAALLLLLIAVLPLTLVWGQGNGFDYGNDWYTPGDPYVKLNVWEDGIYRVSAADLAAGGFSLSGVDPANLHLYYRGKEQHIYVSETSGNVDFIEFYGLRNDGRVDSIMYRNPATGFHDNDQAPNIHLSNFTDTSAYFLTFNSLPGLRYTDFSQTNYAAFTPEPFFRYESYREYHPSLQNNDALWSNAGGSQYDSYHNLNSYWITGEGYVGLAFFHGQRRPVSVPTPFAANLGNPTDVTFRVFGKSSQRHVLEFDIDNNILLTDTTFGIYIRNRSLQYTGPLSNSTDLGFKALGTDNNNTDNNNFCWATLTYDRLFDLDGETQIKMVDWFKPSDSYIQFANADIAAEGYVFDITSKVRCFASASGTNLNAILPGSPGSRTLVVTTDNGFKTPQVTSPSLGDLTDPASGAEFVIITHRSLQASAEAYALYRDTNTVNPLTSKVVYIDEIYDEFGYGSTTPLAIKRFCKYAFDAWTTQPKFFFLWGKAGIQTRYNPSNLIPTSGHPASDGDFVSDYDPFSRNPVPLVPIGRVNVENNTEGFSYLAKVNEMEHTPWQPWMKETVFLGGGMDTTEQKPILNYFRDNYLPNVEGVPVGGKANYFQKYNTGQVSNSVQTSTEQINDGVSVIHFFGHSSANIYDVDIQEPVLYQNFGKYPLMIAFGCYGGRFTTTTKSFGERFVLEPGRGSIGYLANSDAGYLNSLGNYGLYLYPRLFGTHYGQAMGKAIQAAHADYIAAALNQSTINHTKQMNLQGDPSVVLYSADRTDLSISQSDVFFEPSNFSAADSTFTLNVVARNLGRVVQDSFYFSVRQRVPTGSGWISYPSQKIGPIINQDTLSIQIENTIGREMAGLNTFDIFIDSTDVLPEYREDNNRLNYTYVIPGDVPAILFPYDFAVVGSDRVTLSASAFVMTNQSQVPYLFEIDTVPTFNSPRLVRSGTIMGTTGLAQFEVPFDLQDSTVYYWRVRLRDLIPPVWAEASFKYIANRTGWAQSRPPQFFKDPSVKVQMDEINYEWFFEQYSVDLNAFVNEGNNANYRLANGAYSSLLPDDPINGVFHTAIRKRDLIPTIQGTLFGDWLFTTMPDAQGDLINSILRANQGDYYLIVSQRNPNIGGWSEGVFDAMAQLGVDINRMKALPNNHSFIILARVGYPSECITLTESNVFDASTNTNKYDVRKPLQTNYYDGEIGSLTFGPAQSWESLFWDWKSREPFESEDVRVRAFGVRSDNTDSLVYSGLARGTYGLTSLDADRFPYLRLEADVVDSVSLTAPQLEHWHVLFNPAPDAVIDPAVNWAFERDSALRGEDLTVRFTARNVSEWAMDSLLVKFIVQDNQRNIVYNATERYAPLTALSEQVFNHTFSSAPDAFQGNMVLTIELNPDDDQPEQYFFNNFFSHPFFIQEDQLDPIMDVTVDGRHLMDGDIVSPSPEIIIEVNDENPYLAVSDTSFEVHFGFKTPNPANLPRVFVDGNPQMEVIPAELPDNKAQLIFRPGPLEDGDYTLRVQGFDYSGNASGRDAYEIDFEVITESSLSDVLNYPNPFSTRTRFVYTLTGNELPERFEIQIYTISGRLVKVIDLVEQNEVRIGQNITEFAWDGRDEFGDVLANGVYIYKVVAKLNGEDLTYRDEGISSMMKNGFGKMYIMR